jgi:hypothetical protein
MWLFVTFKQQALEKLDIGTLASGLARWQGQKARKAGIDITSPAWLSFRS